MKLIAGLVRLRMTTWPVRLRTCASPNAAGLQGDRRITLRSNPPWGLGHAGTISQLIRVTSFQSVLRIGATDWIQHRRIELMTNSAFSRFIRGCGSPTGSMQFMSEAGDRNRDSILIDFLAALARDYYQCPRALIGNCLALVHESRLITLRYNPLYGLR